VCRLVSDGGPIVKILVFDAYSDVWVHSFPTAIVGDTFANRGHDVHVLRCDGILKTFCVSMSAKGLSIDSPAAAKQQVCKSCKRRRKLLRDGFSFTEHLIEDGITSTDHLKITSILQSITPQNWHELVMEEIQVGRIAAYEFFLTYKLNSLIIPEKLWPIYLEYLRNTLFAFFSTKKLIQVIEPDFVLAYNGLYSTNRIAVKVAQNQGIPTWALHAGSHLVQKFRTISMYDADSLPVMAYSSELWASKRHTPISQVEIDLVRTHLLALRKANNLFVYSPSFKGEDVENIKQRLGIVGIRKVVLAAMSSGDELLAANLSGLLREDTQAPKIFSSANEWITFLVEQFQRRTDLHLVIRVHPREFVNRRDSVISQNAEDLKALLNELPENVSVDWPDMQTSIYDLMSIVDLVLNSTSSAGIEMASVGIPVLLHDVETMFSYDPNVNTICRSKESYMTAVEDLLSTGWSIDNARRAFRWWGFLFTRIAIDISEGFSYPADGYLSQKKTATSKIYNWALKTASRFAPPLHEKRDIRERGATKNANAFGSALEEGSLFAFGPPTIPLDLEEETRNIAMVLKDVLEIDLSRSSDYVGLKKKVSQFLLTIESPS
jgi:hypothetical protein